MATRTIQIPATLYRDFEVAFERAAGDGEEAERTYPLTFSSEKPVRRFDWNTWKEYDEVLSHDPEDVDLSRLRPPDNRIVFLKSHRRDTVVGSIANVEFKKKKGQGEAIFSSVPEGVQAKTLVDENHVPTVSIGYKVTEMTLVKEDKKTGIGTYKCKWQLLEVSQEAMPADESVGFKNRSQSDAPPLVELEVEGFDAGATPTQGERDMSLIPGALPSSQPDGAGGAPAAAPVALGRDYRTEAVQITELCGNFRHLFPPGTDPLARATEWITSGHTPDQVRSAILEMARTPAPRQIPSTEGVRMDPKSKKRYSYRRALNMMAARAGLADCPFDGLERETHEELARTFQGTRRDGMLIPLRIHREGDELREYQAFAARALGTGEATGGQTLIPSEMQLDIIDLLRNAALVIRAGAQYYPGLTGQIPWPKQTGGSTVSWVAENAVSGLAATQPTFGVVNMSPKSMMGVNVVPRQLIAMSSFDVEALIRRDLAEGHALAFDYAAIAGTGTNNMPTGIYSAANIAVEAINGTPSHDQLVGMTTRLAKGNAMQGNLSWMSEPALAGKLMSTQKFAGASDSTLWAGTHLEGIVAGYVARSTNQVPDNLGDNADQKGLIFANWRDLVLGSWGNELEIIVNPYSLDDRGQLKITSHSMGDVAILRDASFCRATGITIGA